MLGAGSWGTTLANLLACKGDDIRLWAYESDVVETVNRERENPTYLPGVALSARIRAFDDSREAVRGAEVVVSVPPSHAVRSVIGGLREAIPQGTLVVSATKGIEADTLALMSQVFAECLPQVRYAVLSGPSFAVEVCQGQPTAVVATCSDAFCRFFVQMPSVPRLQPSPVMSWSTIAWFFEYWLNVGA